MTVRKIIGLALKNVNDARAEFARRHRHDAWVNVFTKMEFRKWLDKNPEFNHFLKGRPELRDTIAHRPGLVFRSDRYDHRYDRRPFDRFDSRDRRWGWQHR